MKVSVMYKRDKKIELWSQDVDHVLGVQIDDGKKVIDLKLKSIAFESRG